MAFNANAFTIVGTAIAIFGVALYVWDTRKDKVASAYSQYTASGQTNQNQYVPVKGGSRHRRRKNSKKTAKRH